MPGAPRWPTRRGRRISTSTACRATSSNWARPASRRCWRPRRGRIPVHRPVADERDIERAAAILTGARRLVIVAGDGAAASGAGPEAAGLGRGARRAGRDDLGRARHHPDDASALGRGRRQLFGAARQPHRARRRAGAVHRLRYRRPGDAELAHPADRHQDRADRSRPAGDRPLLSEHDRPRRRPEGDARRASCQVVGRPARDGSYAEEAARIVADWRAGMARAGREEHGADRRRAAVRRDHPRPAVRRRAGRRYRLFRDLDRHDDRPERRRAELSARRRLARLGLPGLARRAMRRRAAQGRVLHRRRRVLLPPRRIGDGAPLQHPGDDRHQQQLRFRPEPDRGAPHLRQPARAAARS